VFVELGARGRGRSLNDTRVGAVAGDEGKEGGAECSVCHVGRTGAGDGVGGRRCGGAGGSGRGVLVVEDQEVGVGHGQDKVGNDRNDE
jgi:hypothetical protein